MRNNNFLKCQLVLSYFHHENPFFELSQAVFRLLTAILINCVSIHRNDKTRYCSNRALSLRLSFIDCAKLLCSLIHDIYLENLRIFT